MHRLLTTREAADHLGLAVATLANWRAAGRGPAFVKAGGRVRYTEEDLGRWLEAHRTEVEAA